jgi:hypothetical protein
MATPQNSCANTRSSTWARWRWEYSRNARLPDRTRPRSRPVGALPRQAGHSRAPAAKHRFTWPNQVHVHVSVHAENSPFGRPQERPSQACSKHQKAGALAHCPNGRAQALEEAANQRGLGSLQQRFRDWEGGAQFLEQHAHQRRPGPHTAVEMIADFDSMCQLRQKGGKSSMMRQSMAASGFSRASRSSAASAESSSGLRHILIVQTNQTRSAPESLRPS